MADDELTLTPWGPQKTQPRHYSAAFLEFWATFPSFGRGKADAARAYEQTNIRERAAVLAGARRYALEVAGRDPSKVKYAQGWLSGRRWEDYATPIAVRPSDIAAESGRGERTQEEQKMIDELRARWEAGDDLK